MDYAEWCNEGVVSDDIPILMGDENKKTLYELWCEKIGEKKNDIQNDWVFQKAERHRKNALAQYELKSQCFNLHHGIFSQNETRKYMRCFLDGINQSTNTAVKFKYCGSKQIEIAKKKIVTHSTNLSAQYQMSITGFPQVDLIHYDGTHCEVLNVKFDKELATEVIIAVNSFWYKNVLSMEPPRLTAKDIKRAVKQGANMAHIYERISMIKGELEEIKRSKIEGIL